VVSRIIRSKKTGTHFRSLYVFAIQVTIPLCRKFQLAGLNQFSVLIKSDPDKFLAFISHDISNSLETTGVTLFSAYARNTSRKWLLFIPARLATCGLKFWDNMRSMSRVWIMKQDNRCRRRIDLSEFTITLPFVIYSS
jgi:hypothetical protein